LLLASCAANGGGFGAWLARFFRKPPPPIVAEVKYVVGPGYQAGEVWYYPRESFAYESTGIAEVMTRPPEPLTTDGEVYDPDAMAGAHQTLQLPVVVRVTNLANGRQVLLRLNQRGPARPSRMLAVTPRAASLLGFDADGMARVRVQVESAPSQALAHQLNGAAGRLDVQTAPRAAVQEAALPPPPGARGSAGLGGSAASADPAVDPVEESVPLHLPETVLQAAPAPGRLWIDAGHFGRAEYARRRAAQLADAAAFVEVTRGAGQTTYTVRIGPIDTVSEADSLMESVIRDGVSDARVVVE
jgi:rare lipoprotein A